MEKFVPGSIQLPQIEDTLLAVQFEKRFYGICDRNHAAGICRRAIEHREFPCVVFSSRNFIRPKIPAYRIRWEPSGSRFSPEELAELIERFGFGLFLGGRGSCRSRI